VVQVTVSDGNTTNDVDITVTINVTNVNEPPVFGTLTEKDSYVVQVTVSDGNTTNDVDITVTINVTTHHEYHPHSG
jgi:hypothetical protein